MNRVIPVALIACAATSSLLADFSYQQNTQITGGSLAAVMKIAGAFSKQAREPMTSHIYVQGHRMAHVSSHFAEITDADRETITHVDLDHKTYSVMTFAQLKQQMEQMSAEVKKQADANKENDQSDGKQIDAQLKVSAKDTGQKKDIDGLSARQVVLNMDVQGTDPKTGQTGAMQIRSDMWMAPVQGYEQVRDLQKLIAEKIGFIPSGGVLPFNRPDVMKDLGEAMREISKVDGMPVETVMSVGGSGTGEASTAAAATAPSPAESARAAAMSKLAGLGGFGGFGRKKKNQDQPASAPASDSSTPPAGASAVLIEMTTHSNDFSTAPVNGSVFDVPVGFKQVEPDENRHGRHS